MKLSWLNVDAMDRGYFDVDFDGHYILLQFEPFKSNDIGLWFGVELDEYRFPFFESDDKGKKRRRSVTGRSLMGLELRGRSLSVYVEFCSEEAAKQARVDVMTHCYLTKEK